MKLRIPPVLALRGHAFADWEGNRYRLEEDTPVRLNYQEHAMPGYVIAYRVSDGLRMHIQRRAISQWVQHELDTIDA